MENVWIHFFFIDSKFLAQLFRKVVCTLESHDHQTLCILVNKYLLLLLEDRFLFNVLTYVLQKRNDPH